MDADPKAAVQERKLLRFTLDTNCLIDLDEGRPNAPYVRQPVDAHPNGAHVAYVAISASEKQQGGRGQLKLFEEFHDRLKRLGVAHLHEALKGIGPLFLVVPVFRFCDCSPKEHVVRQQAMRRPVCGGAQKVNRVNAWIKGLGRLRLQHLSNALERFLRRLCIGEPKLKGDLLFFLAYLLRIHVDTDAPSCASPRAL